MGTGAAPAGDSLPGRALCADRARPSPTPWELRPWLELEDRFEVSYLLTGSNRFARPETLRAVPARALRDLLPPGPLGELSVTVLGDRYLSAQEALPGRTSCTPPS